MKNINKLLDEFINQPVCYKSYAILRSMIAFCLLLTFLFNSPSLVMPEFIENNEKVYSGLILFKFNLSYFIFQHSSLYWGLSIFILLLIISGFYPRLTGILHFVVAFSYFRLSLFVDGGDQLNSNLTLLLLPITLCDGNANHWKPRNKVNSIYTKTIFLIFSFLISLQICVLYLHASVAKLSVFEWKDGTAIYYWLTHESFGANYFFKHIVDFFLSNKYLTYLINWLVIIVELLIALMLFVPKKSIIPQIVFKLAFFLHLSILFIHGIFTFSLIMISSLIFYFKFFEKNHIKLILNE